MDINAAYREVGSYRGAAEICGTTPKTVKRAVAAETTDPVPVAHNYDDVRGLVVERVKRTQGRISASRIDHHRTSAPGRRRFGPNPRSICPRGHRRDGPCARRAPRSSPPAP